MPDDLDLSPSSSAASSPMPSGIASTPDFAALLDASPDSVITLDRDFRITYANAAAIRISHLDPDGSLGRSYWELRPDMRGTSLETNFLAALQTRRPRRFEFFYARLNLWVDVHLTPHADGIAVFYSDITSAKNAAQTRDQLLLQLEQVYASSPDSILILDSAWNFTFANGNAITLLRSGPLVGQNLWQLFPDNRNEPFNSSYRRTMEERVSTEFEAFYPHPLDLWFRVTARPFADDSIILFFSDITTRKLAEQSRDDLTRELDRVLSATTDAVISLDRNYNFTFLNHRARELLAAVGNPIGQNLWQTFPDAVYPGSPFQHHYARAMDEGVQSSFEAFYAAPLDVWLRIEVHPAAEGIILFFRDITADRLANEALRISENRYRVLTELNPQLIFTSDPEGHVTYANQTLLDFLGMPQPSAGQSSHWLSAVLPEDREHVVAQWRNALRSGTRLGVQARIRRASDGEYHWFDITALPVRGGNEIIQSWLGLAADINDQKTATEALAASEARYRTLTDLNPQFIWMGSSDGRVTYANQRFLEYIGPDLSPSDSNRWLDAFDPGDRDRVLAAWTRAVTTGDDYDVEARLIRIADHASRWFQLRASPVRDDLGAVRYWLGVAIDIHDRRTFAQTLHQKQLETERQRSELESIYENTPVGLALFDPVHFRYLRINDELAKMIGLPKDQIVGRSVLDIASGVATIGELFRQVATGRPVRGHLLEGELSTELGVKRTWNVNYFPVYDQRGNITGITTASLEITQQKKTEAALIQSEKLAAVGRLASSISHEINNPLEAITNLLYLINLHDKLPEDLKVYVHMAQSELSRVSQIATQTLRFHRQAVAPTCVSAAQLVDSVLNLYQGRLANSTIRVEAAYSTARQILCFENDIRQVLNNLIANAIDAMRNGGRLLIRAHNVSDPGARHPGDQNGGTQHSGSQDSGSRYRGNRHPGNQGGGTRGSDTQAPDTRDPDTRDPDTRDAEPPESPHPGIRITIADTGHGMSSHTLSRLFEPFYTTKDLNGTGLGLWISHGIVQRHGGRLTVRSTQHPIHHGTIFSLFLPATPPPAA